MTETIAPAKAKILTEDMTFGDLVEILRDPAWQMFNGIGYTRPDLEPRATTSNGRKIYRLSIVVPGSHRTEERRYDLRSTDKVRIAWVIPGEMLAFRDRSASMFPFRFSKITDYYTILGLAEQNEGAGTFLPQKPKDGHDNESDFRPGGLMGQRMGRRGQRLRVKDAFTFE